MIFVFIQITSLSMIISGSTYVAANGNILFFFTTNIPLHVCICMCTCIHICEHIYALNMPANLENSAVVTGLEKVRFHCNPKERQCQRMFQLPHNYTHFTCQQSNVQNSPSQASAICEPGTSKCLNWFQKMQRNQRSNCQHPLDHQKSKKVPEKHLLLLY